MACKLIGWGHGMLQAMIRPWYVPILSRSKYNKVMLMEVRIEILKIERLQSSCMSGSKHHSTLYLPFLVEPFICAISETLSLQYHASYI